MAQEGDQQPPCSAESLIETLSIARFTVCPLGVPLSSRCHLHISDKHSEEQVLVTNDKQVIACRLGCELGEAGASASLDMMPEVVCASVGEV